MSEKLGEYSYIKMIRQTIKSLALTILNVSIYLIVCSTVFAQQDTVKIMPLGDSITFDLFSDDTSRTDGERIAYRYSLWQLLTDNNYKFDFVGSQSSGYNIFPDADNEGYGAVTDIWIANRVYDFLVANPADVILLHIGTNSLDTNSADVEFLLDEVDRYESDYGKEVWVLLAKIINRSTYSLNTTLFNNNVEAMALDRINDPDNPDKIKVVDMENGAGIVYQLTPDGDMLDYRHPTPGGYTKMANLWYSTLQTILPEPIDPSPQITSTPIISSNIGESYSYDVEAVGDSITYSLTSSPVGMTIDSSSGLVEWVPSSDGEFTITIKALNSSGETTQSYSLFVYDANDCPSGMLHHWRLDESAGTRYSDTFGANDLLTNDSPTAVAGKINGAQNFDGALDGLYTNDVTNFQWSNTSDFTIEYWIKTPSASSASGNEVILGCDDAVNSTHWWAGIWSGGNAAFVLIAEDGSGNGEFLTGTSDLTDGNWHHVVITRDGTTKVNSLYVNGLLEDSKTISYTSDFSSTNIVTVGWLNLGSKYRLEGSLDDLGIYNTTLSSDEISIHYANGLAGYSFCDKFAPVIQSTAVTDIQVNQLYQYDVEAVGNSQPTYTLTTAPASMTINSTTGLIEWTPDALGVYPVTVTVSNSEGNTDQSFNIDVTAFDACPTGIAHYWKFNDANGPAYLDSEAGLNAQIIVSPDSVAGIINDAINFDGTSDEIYIPSDASFDWNSNSSFSIEYWVKTPSSSSAAGNEVIIGRDDKINSTHWWGGIWSGGYAAFVLISSDGSGGSQYLTGTTDITDGSWHHIALIRNSSSNLNKLYVDGVLEDSKTVVYNSGFSSSENINAGWLDLGGHYRFEGSLDELVVYDKALTDSEVEGNYQGGLASYGICDLFAPIVYSTPLTEGEVDALYSYDVDAAGNPTVSYALSVYPSGMTIDENTGLIQWTPSSQGTIPVSVLVSNLMGTIVHSFNIIVEEVNTCPVDLTHYWKFDKRTSGIYSDSEGALDVEIVTLPDSVVGIVNSALSFNGTSHEIYAASNSDFNWTNNSSFTLSYWMKTPESSTAAGNEVIVGRDDLSNPTHWWSGIWSGGKAAFVMKASDGSGGTLNLEGITDVTDGQWHLIVVTRDGVNKTNNLYVDGVLEDSKVVSYTADITSTEFISIGWLNLGGHYRFEGTLDELTYFSKTLSDYEINNLYQNTKVGDNLCLIKAPVVNSAAITQSYNGVEYNYKLDVTGNPLPTLTKISGPAEMSLDVSTGTLTWTPDTDGSYSINIQVENSEGIINHTYNLNITTQANYPPYLANAIADFSFAEDNIDSTINLTTVFADSNLIENLSYSYSGNEFLSININSGKVYLTPVENWFGSEELIFTATDKGSLSVSDTVVVTVTSVNDAPSFTYLPTQTIIIDSPLDIDLASAVNDVDNNISDLIFSAPTIIGDGINVTIDNNLDLAHLIADSSGEFQVVFEAQDIDNAIGRDTLNLTVLNLYAKQIIVSEGWNMISVPLQSENMEKDSLFNNTASQAYYYKNGYNIEDTLKLGVGYWLKFSVTDSVMIYGINSSPDSITVYQGWNMIGPFYDNVSTDNITSDITNNISSQVYGFNNGYYATNTLVAGYSYWIKVAEDDVLRFSNVLPKKSNDKYEISKDEKIIASIIVENNINESKTLKILNSNLNSGDYELPPKPPANIFDVRFASNQMAEDLEVTQKILISTENYPVNISVTNVPIVVKDVINGEFINEVLLPNQMLAIKNKNINQIEVSLLTEKLSYKLEQNYPNPFNPNTTINFTVPTESLVTIDVFDILGQKVKTLVNEMYSPGYHKIIFEANHLATGVYFYKITSGSFTDIKKMLLIK